MAEASLRHSVAGRSNYQPVKRFHPTLFLALTALILNTYAISEEIARAYGAVTYTSNTVLSLLLLIELGLLASAAGLWRRKTSGAVISLTGLSFVGIGYAVWYVYSIQVLNFLTSKPFYQAHPEALPRHLFYLVDATWLNFAVLLISGILLIREAMRLRGSHIPLR